MIFMLLVLGAAVALVVIVVGVFIARRVGPNATGDILPTYITQHPPLQPPDAVRQEVAELAQRGEKIAAIKLLRDHAPVGLKEAKDYVEQIARMPAGAAPAPGSRLPHAAEQEELRMLMRQGKKIQAIKQYREITGVGLKEAKDAVEAL